MAETDPLALALQALSHKERSVAELGDWLRARGVGEAEVGETLDHLIQIGTLDDSRFAQRFAEDKRELAGWGADRIRGTLAKRGVGAAEIDAALGDDEVTELERAVALLGERDLELSDDRSRNRALGLLARRGYDSEVAYEAIRRAGADA